MKTADLFGNQLSTSSERAATCYNEALTRLYKLNGDPRPWVDEAIACDPSFALAYCVDARVALFEANPVAANQAAAKAVDLAAKASERERSHAYVVANVTANKPGTLDAVFAHATTYPRDSLPLSFALGVYGLLGFGCYADHHERQLAFLESVGAHWSDEWWYQSWLGWSLVETGNSERGTELLDAALLQAPDNANAIHGRAHGYYEMGQAEAGERFILNWLPSYNQDQPLHCHLAWHVALHQLQQGNFTDAADVYARYISPAVSKALPMFTLVDSAAYMWRAKLYGAKVNQADIAQVHDFLREHFPKPGLPFVNWHRQVVLALANDPQLASEFIQWEKANGPLSSPRANAQHSADTVAARLSYALICFAENRPADAANHLANTLNAASVLGGSHAQRDILTDSLVAMSLRAGDISGARRDGLSRYAKRATHLNQAWFTRMQAAVAT